MNAPDILAPVASLTLPDAQDLAGRAQRALAFIRELSITGPDEYELAAEELRAIKARAAKLEEQRTGITGPINKALKAINDLFRGPSELLAEAERTLKGKMLAYDQEQARIAAEARRKAEEAAAIERARLAEEAAARQREAAEQAAAAERATAEGDAQAAELARAAAIRAQAEAAAVATTAQLVTAAPVVAEPAAKVKGIATVSKIEFEVVDFHALVKHIAERPELLALISPDNVKLRAYVRGLGTACALPGVRVFEEKTMRARAA